MSKFLISFVITTALVTGWAGPSYSENFTQVEKFFALRNAITEHGNAIPEQIKNSTGSDLRTLERIFEMETSTLTTIEAYFRILMIAVSTKSETDPGTVKILNGWLDFISNQCKYDIEYLEEAPKETDNTVVLEEIIVTKNNTEKLADIVKKSIAENSAMLEQ